MLRRARLLTSSDYISLPVVGCANAGVPTTTYEHEFRRVDVPVCLVPDATSRLVEVSGESMAGAGIHDKMLLVVSLEVRPRPNVVVIVDLDGEHAIKWLRMDRHGRFGVQSDYEHRSGDMRLLTPPDRIVGVATGAFLNLPH